MQMSLKIDSRFWVVVLLGLTLDLVVKLGGIVMELRSEYLTTLRLTKDSEKKN